MEPFPLGNDTIVVTQRSVVLDSGGHEVLDGYGRPGLTATVTTVTGAAVRVLSSNETNTNVNPTDMVARMLLPWGTAVDSQSAVSWSGFTFEVQGDPRMHYDLDGDGDHVEITCRCRKG